LNQVDHPSPANHRHSQNPEGIRAWALYGLKGGYPSQSILEGFGAEGELAGWGAGPVEIRPALGIKQLQRRI
jgi:hypothetical protein